MQHLKVFGQLRQTLPHRLVDGLSAAGAAHHHQNRPAVVQAEAPEPALLAAAQDLGSYGRTGVYALATGILHGLREGAALGFGKGQAQLVGQTGGHVRFMADHGHAVQLRTVNHGYRYEAALGEYHIGFDRVNDSRRLPNAVDHAKGIGKVFRVKITAQLAYRDGVEGDALHLGDQLLLGAVGRADVMDFPSVGLQAWNQRQVRRDMPGGSAAGENDFFQYSFPLIQDA